MSTEIKPDIGKEIIELAENIRSEMGKLTPIVKEEIMSFSAIRQSVGTLKVIGHNLALNQEDMKPWKS